MSRSPTVLRNVMCLSSHVVILRVTVWLHWSREELSSVLSPLSLVPVCRYLKAAFSFCYLNVQIIVRDSKASDGNDYGVENNRFPLASADC